MIVRSLYRTERLPFLLYVALPFCVSAFVVGLLSGALKAYAVWTHTL